MKKIYLFLAFISISTLSMAQIGPLWWQFLPDDFEDNPYPRKTIMVLSAEDSKVTSSNSLEELWSFVDSKFIYPIDAVTNYEVNDYKGGVLTIKTAPEQSSEDFTGSFTLIAGDDALYVLYKVIDDEVDVAEDYVEMHFAPYGGKFDPGREIFPDTGNDGLAGHWWADSMSLVWGWNTETNLPVDENSRVIKGNVYTEMAKYGSWTEVGAYKVDLALQSSPEVFPPAVVYTMKGENKDILGDVQGGSLPIPMQTLLEPTSNGYYFLTLVPWEIMPTGKLENVGDQMSFAAKVNDYDSNNFRYTNIQAKKVRHTYNIWGGTDNNEAYWAIAFYGAIAELSNDVLNSAPGVENSINAFYAHNQLLIRGTDNDYSVTIYDVNGKATGEFSGMNQIECSYLNPGFYFANISDKNGNRTTVKFVKSTF